MDFVTILIGGLSVVYATGLTLSVVTASLAIVYLVFVNVLFGPAYLAGRRQVHRPTTSQ